MTEIAQRVGTHALIVESLDPAMIPHGILPGVTENKKTSKPKDP